MHCFQAQQTASTMAAKGLALQLSLCQDIAARHRSIVTCQIVFLPFHVLIMSDRVPKAHHFLDLQWQPQNFSAGHHTASSCMGHAAGNCTLMEGHFEGRALMPSIFSLACSCHEVPVTVHVELVNIPEGMVQWPGSAS